MCGGNGVDVADGGSRMKRDLKVFTVGLVSSIGLAGIAGLVTTGSVLEFVFWFCLLFVCAFCVYMQVRTPIVTGEELQRNLDMESKRRFEKTNRA